MTKPIKHKLPETREEWIVNRLQGIGGSDAGVIMGVNRWKSPYTLWAEKTALLSQPDIDNEAMRQGRDLEEYVAKRFCEQEGKKVRRSGFSFQSADYPWMLANIDRDVVGENAGLECKTANIFADDEYMKGNIPLSYYCQMLHYMEVKGYDRMYLAVVVFGRNFHVFTVDRADPGVEEDIAALIRAEKDFWERVEKKEPPELDGSDSTTDTLRCIYSDSDDGKVDISSLDQMLQTRDEIKDEIKELEARSKHVENEVRLLLENSVIGVSSKYKVTNKVQSSTRLDSKRLKAEKPEIYEAYAKTSESKVLRITKLKEKKEEK